MALLEVNTLDIVYRVKSPLFGKPVLLRAVNDVTFSMEHGEIVGLVGESGCGKSTLGKALVHLETPARGSVHIDGVDIFSLKSSALRKMRRQFQMIFQDPYSSLNPRLSIFQALDEVISLHFDMPGEARRQKAAELLEEVGLPREALDRYPHQFSGGQRQRVGIARALAAEPEFIVADEPVSALDVSVQASIVNLLREIRDKKKTSFLFIAHDLAVTEHISDRIMVMYLGRIVESAPAKELVANARHPYTRALLSAVPSLHGKNQEIIKLSGDVPSPLDYPSGCPFHPRCPFATEKCRTEVPKAISPRPDGEHLCSCHLF